MNTTKWLLSPIGYNFFSEMEQFSLSTPFVLRDAVDVIGSIFENKRSLIYSHSLGQKIKK